MKKFKRSVLLMLAVLGCFSTFSVGCSLDSPSEDNSYIVTQQQKETTTLGQRNALQSAKNYLRAMAFSYEGLKEQLEFEGYSSSEATYAVDNCGADWFEQAKKKAKEYLNVTFFSKQGLIEQLEFEGFTYEQAVYGVEENGY